MGEEESVGSVEFVEIVLRYRRVSPASPFELVGSDQKSSSIVLSALQVIFLLTEFVRGAMQREFPLVEEKLAGLERRVEIVKASGMLPDLKRLPN